MKKILVALGALLLGIVVLLFIIIDFGHSGNNIPVPEQVEKLVNVHKLNDRVIIINFGADVVTAFNSQKGIVVVDAGISNSLTCKLREVIEREFKNSKIAYLINTHSHSDHTGGNQVFSDVPIIGHEDCFKEMTQRTQDREKIKAAYLKIADEYETELRKYMPGSDEWNGTYTQKMRYKLAYDDWANGRVVTYPTITFNDRFTLYAGDITFDMVYFGRAHTGTDIMIHIPELKILMTGDLFYYGSRPSFGDYEKQDVERWLVAKEWYTERLEQIETLVGGHGQIMDKEELSDFSEFINNKWAQLN